MSGTDQRACPPTCQPSSPAAPPSSEPSPLSWQRSDVLALIDALDDADALLHVVWRVEGRRPSGEAALDAAGALKSAREDLAAMLELASGPQLCAVPDAAVPEQPTAPGPTPQP